MALSTALAFGTAFCWGALPIALSVALQGLDPYTITWYRFTVATVLLGAILVARRSLPKPGQFSRRAWILLAIAFASLVGNCVLFLFAIGYTSPSVAQTLGQLSSLFLLLGGVVVFKERLSSIQWGGFMLLFAGLALFFNDRLPQLYSPTGGFGLGAVIMVIATLVWAAYGLAQKRLLDEMCSPQILLLLYAGAVLVLLPAASPASIRGLDTLQLAMLGFCCLDMVLAGGAFAEALKHSEVSRVGAVLATTPLFTIAIMELVERFVPQILAPEHLNALSVFGALLVVWGSAICALANQPRG